MSFKEFFWTPIAAGIVDGLNPCFLMTFAVVFMLVDALRRWGISRSWVFLFISILVFAGFAFNCGVMDRFLLSSFFQMFARACYLVLAVVVAWRGFRLFKQWLDIVGGKASAQPSVANAVQKPSVILLMTGVVAGALLMSMMMTLWPINAYIMTFSVYMMMPGQLIALGVLVFIYSVVSYWFVVTGLLVFNIQTSNPRLFKMVSAAILLSASLGVLDVIFTKG